MKELTVGSRTLAFMEGDITKVEADAIGNAANSGLRGGGGVDGAIHRAGGPSIMAELDEIRPKIGGKLATGDAVTTKAGDLPAQWVIHAVGPVYNDGEQGEPKLLASCYRRILELADEKGARTVALPSISTGVYGYPLADAARIAVETVAEALRGETSVKKATFVLFGDEAYQTFVDAAEEALG